MIYAYYRVSTRGQDYESQKVGLVEFCERRNLKIDVEVIDHGKSGKLPPSKRNLGILLANLQSGDVVICSEISRLARSLLMLMDILKQLMDKEVKLYCVKENYELGDNLISKVLAFAFGLTAEIERNLISQRTLEGLERARRNGKILGRQVGTAYRKLKMCEDYVRETIKEGIPATVVAKKCGCSYTTLYRFMKEKGISKPEGVRQKRHYKGRVINLVELVAVCKAKKTITEACQALGCGAWTFNRYRKKYGIKMVEEKGKGRYFYVPDDLYGDVIGNPGGVLMNIFNKKKDENVEV